MITDRVYHVYVSMYSMLNIDLLLTLLTLLSDSLMIGHRLSMDDGVAHIITISIT